MGCELLDLICSSGAKVSTVKLQPASRFCLAADSPDGTMAWLVCTHSATMDVDIRVRQGTSLKLRNPRWLVSYQRIPEPLLVRPLLEFLGLNTSEILATASDRSAGIVDVRHLNNMEKIEGEGRVSRVLDGVFHVDGDVDVADEVVDGAGHGSKNSTTDFCDLGN